MNKNWLYRVLALALVAMLALPMFALADEVLPEQGEVAAEAGEVTLGEDEAVAKTRISSATAGDIVVDLAYGGVDEVSRVAGSTSQLYVLGVGSTNKVSFKSSNKKVATVNGEGVLTAVDVGTAKITVSGKTNGGKKLSTSFKVKVTDVWRANKVNGVFDVTNPNALQQRPTNGTDIWVNATDKYDGDKMGKKGLVESGETIKFYPGEGWTNGGTLLNNGANALYFDVMALNSDGQFLDGIDTNEDGARYEYDRGYSWKITSGSDKVFVDNAENNTLLPGKRNNGFLDNTPTDPNPDNGLHFEFFKPGKAKLVVTAATISGNKTAKSTFNIEVKNNKKTFYKPTKEDLNTAKKRHTLYYGIQSIEVKDMENVEVTLFFVNGTDFSVNKLRNFDIDISTGYLPTYANGYANYTNVTQQWVKDHATHFVGYNAGHLKTINTAIKSGKTTTVKLTFKNKYTFNNVAANSQWGSMIRKAGFNNEITEPYQNLNADNFYYIIDNLSFDLAGGFYRSEVFNPTCNIPGAVTPLADGSVRIN